MARSGSVRFPFREDVATQALQRAETVEDVIASSIRAFLLTDPGSRRGNPVGSFVPSLLHKLIPKRTIPDLEDELKQELTQQFPGIAFTKVQLVQDLSNDTSTLRIGIIFSSPVSELSELTVEITE